MSKGLVRKISNLSMFCGGSVPSKEEKGTATRIFVDYKIVLSVTWIFSRVVILWRVCSRFVHVAGCHSCCEQAWDFTLMLLF